MRGALLGELPRFLERATRRGPVRLHAELTSEDQHSDLRVDLADLSRELQSGLRCLQGLGRVALREDLGLRGSDRRERAVTLRLLGQPRRAHETFPGTGEVAVIDIQ